MDRAVVVDLVRRAMDVSERQRPEMAPTHLEVPLEYFRSEEWAAKERTLYETSPLALVASSELSAPDDYLVRDAVGRSVLLTRDHDGVAHAFLNYCRHRGAEPVLGCGNARRFTCPYHGWVYDTSGRVVGMPLRDRHDGFDLAPYGLVELPLEERHGFVWVVLTPGHPIDVAAHLGALDEEIGALRCDRMRYYASHEQARLDVNWKAVAEGLLDGLHVPFVHAETFGLNPQAANVDVSFVDRIGPHVRWGFPMFLPDDVPRLRALPDDELHAGMLGCVWLISPGLLLANELYGIIYADLTPGRALDEAYLRYGWLSPYDEGPEGMPSPEHMAARARKAVFEDQEVWEGCGRGLTLGAHDAELIGRNEYAIQLFHEGLAEQTGYPGLRRVGG